MALSVAQMYKQYVNKRVALTIGPGVEVAGVCTDARVVYGNSHVLVQPILGRGSMWIGIGAIRVVPTEWPKEASKELVEAASP